MSVLPLYYRRRFRRFPLGRALDALEEVAQFGEFTLFGRDKLQVVESVGGFFARGIFSDKIAVGFLGLVGIAAVLIDVGLLQHRVSCFGTAGILGY